MDLEDKEIETENDTFDTEEYEEPKKKNTLIIVLVCFFLLLLITGGIFWLISTREVEDLTVPDVTELTVEEAIQKLQKEGFTYTTEQANSDSIKEGFVIKTKPKAGSTRKKGDTITIVESIGGSYYYLENYVGEKYSEVLAKLELLGINVIVEKKDVEKKEDYKGKEDIIIEQSPKFDASAEKVLVESGDTITLYIPNIVNEYPDIVNEGWTLTDVIAFAEEYKLNLSVYDSSKTAIPKEEYEKFKDSKVISQSRPVGDTIIEGFNFNVDINAKYVKETPEPTPDKEEDKPNNSTN